MFKSTTAKTVAEYIKMIEDLDRRSDIQKLHRFITKIIPELKPHILAGMIGYGTYHYKYASGREGNWSIVALANQKNYISLYVCAATKDGYVTEKYKAKLPKASIGKSCIRFKKLADIDLSILKKIIQEGVAAMSEKAL